jgi:hypothetical protein
VNRKDQCSESFQRNRAELAVGMMCSNEKVKRRIAISYIEDRTEIHRENSPICQRDGL